MELSAVMSFYMFTIFFESILHEETVAVSKACSKSILHLSNLFEKHFYSAMTDFFLNAYDLALLLYVF